ncbi:unnamed protein product [Arctia plantaginis]|uniref:Uncharacterized protein n=1 Tax=Arctia plantaginis TaxID=874455 RepID=A0A8S1BN70_ARCPL|nr:unnamed protein product [Arctia plantaginis]
MKLFGMLFALVMLISAFGFVELASLGVRCPDDSSTTGERCIPSDGWDPQHSAQISKKWDRSHPHLHDKTPLLLYNQRALARSTIFDVQASEKCETFKINKYQ